MLKTNTKTVVLIGIMAALSIVLMIFPHFPIIPAAPWLDVDFSDVPALLISVAISPTLGLLVVLVKNVVHLAFTTTAFVGELSNFIIGSAFVFSAGLFSKFILKNKVMRIKLLAVMPLAAVVQLVAAILCNYFIMVPLYSAFVNFEEIGGALGYILTCVIPFNFIKDLLVSVAFWLVYSYIYPHIRRNLY